MNRTDAYEKAYPNELWKNERVHLQARIARPRGLPDDGPRENVVGFALSGGGIRSATFCLGAFQALARLRLLHRIDYVSTVSGGGYFGSFLGRLYRRDQIETVDQIEALLDPAAARARRPAGVPDVVDWLRENGRYLSPNGSGDLLVGAAIMLRNWVTIHVVVLTFAMLWLLLGQAVRIGVELAAPVLRWDQSAVKAWLWWSPWVVTPGIAMLVGAVPLAWAFWMTGRWRRASPFYEWPVWGVVLTGLIALHLLMGGWQPFGWARWRYVGGAVLAIIVLMWIAWQVTLCLAKRAARRAGLTGPAHGVFALDRQRNLLSVWLKFALVITSALLVFALVDSLGQTLYLAQSGSGSSSWPKALYSALGALAGGAAFAQRIATALAGKADGGRLRLPVAALVTAGALLVVTVLLVSLSVLTHAVAWRFEEPAGAPMLKWAAPSTSPTAFTVSLPETADGSITAAVVVPEWRSKEAGRTCGQRGDGPCVRDAATFGTVLALVGILLLFGLLFGRCWQFINQSSLYSMYSARLTRAYLGASNPGRKGVRNEGITDVMPDDNIDPSDYWTPAYQPPQTDPDGKDPRARPLHLINVTINETLDGESKVQQQDRKGTGLAIGPCAFSVGIRHHAVFSSHRVFATATSAGSATVAAPPGPSAAVTVFPAATHDGQAVHRVFVEDGPARGWAGGETLSIGKWTGISGAAFSTGLGSRTSLGLSLLCGLFNVRLGYWWDSRTAHPPGCRPLRFDWWFPVQSYLISEFVSRFYGTSRPHWYLSDGGHFENMGGYELIRRRIGRIVIIDAEADPDYTFEGLSNLIRKARLDFGADIRFLNETELTGRVPPSHRQVFGTLEQLRRGKWMDEPVDDRVALKQGVRKRRRLTVEEPIDEARLSLAHAALAEVRYIDEPADRAPGILLYIKPTLIGDEPSDVIQYHRGHLPFPQETTADQFFDEAQWESYRALGDHIGHVVFGPGVPTAPSPGYTPPPPPTELIFG